MFGSIFYGRGTIEQTLYLGILPLFLAHVAHRRRRRSRDARSPENFAIGFFIVLAGISFLFSMPPYINFGLFKVYFPSFFIHKILPMLRAYARFGVLAMLSVSVLAGFGFVSVIKRMASRRKRSAFVFIAFVVLFFEFTNIPPFHAMDAQTPPPAYQWLASQKGDFAIAEYPLGETGPGEAFMPYNYLFWQRIHHKKLINGAKYGTTAYRIKRMVQNITNKETAGFLSWLGAKYIIAHMDMYKRGEDRLATDIIGETPNINEALGFKLVRRFGDTHVFEIIAEPQNPGIH